ncbi:iron-containing alcohol dehydrogenase [Clostridium botulinum]|nr:iron-containing alcohol dehydrogenase [Clostridium botulinum]
MSALYDVTHGAGLAVIFPAWMKHVMKNAVDKFAQMAVRVWGCEMDFENPEKTALEGIHRLENFLKSIGMTLTFEEIGAKESDIPHMVEKLMNGKDKVSSLVGLTAKDVEEIYRLAL